MVGWTPGQSVVSLCNTRGLPNSSTITCSKKTREEMAKGGKARYVTHSFGVERPVTLSHRTVIIRMISTAQTGFFYTTKRVRLNSPKLSAVKYDPIGARRVSSPRTSCLFLNDSEIESTFCGKSKDEEIMSMWPLHTLERCKYTLTLG